MIVRELRPLGPAVMHRRRDGMVRVGASTGPAPRDSRLRRSLSVDSGWGRPIMGGGATGRRSAMRGGTCTKCSR